MQLVATFEDPYRPGDRLWVKHKNRNTALFAEELAGARRRRSRPGV